MMITVPRLLTGGRAALQQGDKAAAKTLLTQLVTQDEHNEDGWLWLAAAVDTLDDQRVCLENVLHLNPDNRLAQQGLAELYGATQAVANTAPPPRRQRRHPT